MREFKGRSMRCDGLCCGGKTRHEPGIRSFGKFSIYVNMCINCGTPKITRRTAVWDNSKDSPDDRIYGKQKSIALRELTMELTTSHQGYKKCILH